MKTFVQWLAEVETQTNPVDAEKAIDAQKEISGEISRLQKTTDVKKGKVTGANVVTKAIEDIGKKDASGVQALAGTPVAMKKKMKK
jgi:hypothetical protein